jgi:hypothetical protein
MIKDLGAIYKDGTDGSGDGDPQTTGSGKGRSLEGMQEYGDAHPSGGLYSGVNHEDLNAYLPYMPQGVYSSRDKSIDFIRGENQGVGEQLAKRTLDIIPNVAGGLLQFFGVMGSLATEWGKDDKDYNNALVTAGNAIHNFGGWGDIYRENNDVFAPSDPGWWIDNIGQLADSAIPFAIGGAGVAGVLEKAAVGIGDLVNLGANGARILRGAAQLGTAAYMSYAEGAQAGQQVFDGVYQKQMQTGLNNGMDWESADKRAKVIASSSAASTVQLNTILGTALNLSSVAPFFRKSEDVVTDILSTEMKQGAGESITDWAARVRNLQADQFASKLIEHHGLKSYLKEGAQEGIEEVMNNFTQNTGEQEGEQGNIHGFWDQFGQLEHWFDRTMDQQGALAFVLGAAGGIANTIAVSHLPHQRTTQYEDGQHQALDKEGNLQFKQETNEPVYQKHFASPHNIDKWGKLGAFNSVKDTLAEDVDRYTGMQGRYMYAVKSGDAIELDKAKQEMFNPLVFNAVKRGIVAPWVDQFQKIAQMTPEEADTQGYGDDYKQQADKAVSQLQEAGVEYQKLHDKYGLQWEANSGARQVLDMVFHKKVELMQWDNMIKDHEAQLAKSRAEETKEAQLLNPDSYDSQVDNLNRKWKSAQVIQAKKKSEINALRTALEAGNYDKVSEMLRQYRAKGIDNEDIPGAVKDLSEKLVAIHNKVGKQVQDAEDALLHSSGFIQYQNEHPDATFADFMKSVQQGYELNQQNLIHEISIDNAKTQYEVAAKNYTEITQEKTLNRFIRKANDWQEKLAKAQQEQEDQGLADIQSKARDASTLDRASRIQLDSMAARYRQQRDTHLSEAAELGRSLDAVRAEREQLKIYKDPLRMSALKRQEKELERKIAEANARAKHYDSLNTQYSVNTATPEVTEQSAKEEAEKKDEEATADNVQQVPDSITALPEGEVIEEATGTTFVDEEGNLNTEPEEATHIEEVQETFPEQFSTPEQYEAEMNSDPTIKYADLLLRFPEKIQDLLPSFEQQIRNGEITFSYDLLRTQVAQHLVSQSESAQVLQALKNYIEQNPVEKTTPATSVTASQPASSTTSPEAIAAHYKNMLDKWESIQNGSNTSFNSISALGREVLADDRLRKLLPQSWLHSSNPSVSDEDWLMMSAASYTTLNDNLRHLSNSVYVNPVTEATTPETLLEEAPATYSSEPVIDVAPIEVTDSPVISFTDDAAIEKEGARHLGKKAEDALTIANTTFANVRDVLDPKLGGIRKEVDKDRINEHYNQDLLDGKKLLPGTDIYFEVATDYEGDRKDYNSLETDEWGNPKSIGKERFEDYATQDNKVKSDNKSIGNVPIRIKDRNTGKVIGWIKKWDFINAKFPNTSDYRNIVDIKYDTNGVRIDNLHEQNERLMKLRRLIVSQFNAGANPLEGVTISKGAGFLILNRESNNVSSKLKPGFARNHKNPELSLLPDETLVLGIVHKPPGSKGEVHTRFKTKFTGNIAGEITQTHGSVVVLLPAADGSYHIASLSGQKLADDKRQTSVNTVTHVIELYLKNDGTDANITNEIAQLKSNIGHDISTASGLKSFINQYFTYTQDFKDSQTISSGEGKEEFLFRIGEPNLSQSKGEIKIGWANSGKPVVSARLINGKLDPAFITQLLAGFKVRPRAVVYTDSTKNLRGINEASDDKFYDAIYTTDSKWRHTEYPSYNEYVKSFSKTIVYGRNKLDNGKYNYVANPSISYSYNDPAAFPVLPEGESGEAEPTTMPDTHKAMEDSDLDLFNTAMGLFNDSPEVVEAIGTPPDNSQPVSLATLQEMYNFTPEALRNGRTPAEIYDQLNRTGITWMSEGYNPFTRCL